MFSGHTGRLTRNRHVILTALPSTVLAAAFAAPLSCLFAAGAIPHQQESKNSSSVPQDAQGGNALQAQTRLVTVDVVATDSHGKPIRGLQAEDFEVSDGGRQKIEKFAFIDGFTAATSATHTAPVSGSYSNQLGVDTLASPPTVVLIDSLNTATPDLAQTKRHMLDLLKTLPSDTPVAVLLLGTSLHLLQNFTTDPSLLRSAIGRATRSPSVIAQMPQDNPNSLSLLQTEANDDQENDDIQLLEDFEKETYANQMDIRVTTTLNALRAIAGLLRADPGRKNLIWVSESFPLALWPDYEFGTSISSPFSNIFAGTRGYADQLQEAANALTDARVAIYPVDARGLDTNVSASQHAVNVPGSVSRNPGAQIRRVNMARMMAQTTMDQLAETTGGRTCKNRNDLSGCVETATRDSSSYYEIAYSPEGIKWDGSFRKISVSVHRSGVKLAYRRGYYAQDASQAAKQSPDLRLRSACEDLLPSPAIPISAKAVAPDRPGDASYRISIPSGAFTVLQEGDSYKLSAMLASCVFPPAGASFSMFTHDLSQRMSGPQYAEFQTNGIQGPADYSLQGATRFRIAVLDESSGLVGALDLPVRLADFKALAPALAAITSVASKAPSAQLSTSIGFHVPTGESAKLDWTAGKLVYTGDIAVEKSAPALFQQFYTSKRFHCSRGALAADDPAAGAPTLRLTFIDSAGASSIVDLKGEQPEYSGAIPVDDSAKPFFQRLWYLVHCQAAQ
jgi:VWFA-related protein